MEQPSNGRTSKTRSYFLYAIGEVFLVVVGILIALQINNWNEERQFKDQTTQQLISLKETLLQEQDFLEQNRKLHAFRYHSIQKYLEFAKLDVYLTPIPGNETLDYEQNGFWTKPFPTVYDREFIDITLAWTSRYRRFNVNANVIEEMEKQSMLVNLSPSLLKALNSYYLTAEFRFGEQDKNVNIDNWNDILLKKGYTSLNPSKIKDPLALLRNDIELAANLRMIAGQALWLGDGSTVLLKLNSVLLQEIENELKVL